MSINPTIPFNQASISVTPILEPFVKKFSGLCELICNQIIKDNLLGKEEADKEKNFFDKKITAETLSQDSIRKSHLLDNYSTLEKTMAFIFGLYPSSLFSFCNSRYLLKATKKPQSINKTAFNEIINAIPIDNIQLKLKIYRGDDTPTYLMIEKNGNTYDFIDFNGEKHRNLSPNEITNLIEDQYTLYKWKQFGAAWDAGKLVNYHILNKDLNDADKDKIFIFRSLMLHPPHNHKKLFNSESKRKVDAPLLMNTLDKLASGTTLKLEVLNHQIYGFYGHSCLIKKTSDSTYIFFDPNQGEFRDLSAENLTMLIDDLVRDFDATEIHIFPAEVYLKKMQDAKIWPATLPPKSEHID
jgi:hypothetical protein